MDPIRKTGGKSGRPVISMDGGKTWAYEDETPQAPSAPATPAAPRAQGEFRRAEDMVGANGASPYGVNNLKATAQDPDLAQSALDAGEVMGSAAMLGGKDEVRGAAGALMGGDYEEERAKSEARTMAAQARMEGRAESARQDLGVGSPLNPLNAVTNSTPYLQAAGSGAPAAIAAPAMGGAGVIRAAATEGGVQGGLSAQPGQRGAGVLKGAATSAATAGALQAPAKVVKAVGGLTRPLVESADRARLRSAGIDPAQAHASGGIPETAAALRRNGVSGIGTAGMLERKAADANVRIGNERADMRAAVPADDRITGDAVGRRIEKAAGDRVPVADIAGQRRYADAADAVSNQVVMRPVRAADPGLAATRPANQAIPRPEMRPEKTPRLLGLDELVKSRRYYGNKANFDRDAPEAFNKDMHGAYAGAEADLVGRHTGAGDRYSALGRDQKVMIDAQEGLLSNGGGSLPVSKLDALRRVSRGLGGSVVATGLEGAAGVAKSAQAAAPGMAGRAQARVPAGSVLSRQVNQQISNAEYPEDEYFRQYMSNPDYRHSRR